MIEVHVGKNMYKGDRVSYSVRSAHPSTTKKNKNKQTNKQKTTKNTHRQTHLIVWCRTGGGESIMLRCTPARKRRYRAGHTTQIRSHKRSGGNINNARIVDGVAIVMEIFLTNF